MKIDGGAGHFGKIPINGGRVTLDDQDVNVLANTAIGVTKKLLIAGGAITAVGILASIVLKKREVAPTPLEKARNMNTLNLLPLSSLVMVNTYIGRDFIGICTNEKIAFSFDGHEYSVPIDRVARIFETFKYGLSHAIDFIDGTRYDDIDLKTPIFKFFSIQGAQTIVPAKIIKETKGFLGIPNYTYNQRYGKEASSQGEFVVRGARMDELEILRDRLASTFNQNLSGIKNLLGVKVFDHYFIEDS